MKETNNFQQSIAIVCSLQLSAISFVTLSTHLLVKVEINFVSAFLLFLSIPSPRAYFLDPTPLPPRPLTCPEQFDAIKKAITPAHPSPGLYWSRQLCAKWWQDSETFTRRITRHQSIEQMTISFHSSSFTAVNVLSCRLLRLHRPIRARKKDEHLPIIDDEKKRKKKQRKKRRWTTAAWMMKIRRIRTGIVVRWWVSSSYLTS